MISASLSAPEAPPRSSQLDVLTALSAALLAMTILWAFADTRMLNGSPVWAKPMKFALSFLAMFGTLALVERRLSPAWPAGLVLRSTVMVMAAAMIAEMAYMIVMAAQQEASHFNLSTPFFRLMYSLMGAGAVSLLLGVAIFGIAALRDDQAELSPALRWGIGWGFLQTFVLTLVTAGYMASSGTHVGPASPGSATLPLLGWSATVGDIRPAHFLALHAMQVLPLAGLWFDRRGIDIKWMRWVASAYAALTLAVFAQALAGQPLLRL